MLATRFKKILETAPIFLLMAPAYVFLHLEKIFHRLIVYRFALPQLLILCVASGIFIVFCRLIFQEKKKAWIIAFFLMLWWFYLGILKNFLQEYYPDAFFSSYTFILPFVALFIITTAILIKKYKGPFHRLFLFLNLLWIIFIVMDGISIFLQELGRPSILKKYALDLPSPDIADSLRPDIYYIVFDSYSGNLILRGMGFDNHMIEEKLVASGYRIVDSGTSNYNLTPFSIGSTLNMKYLDEADTGKKYFLDEFLPAANIVKYNGLVPWLERTGYTFKNYSFFDFAGQPSAIPTHDIWDIEDIYLQQNAGLKIYKDLFWNFKLRSLNDAEKIQKAIDQRDAYDDSVYSLLLNSATINQTSPRFIYAHFFMPHIPNSHDSSGKRIPVNTKISVEQEMEGYTNEIRFINTRINKISDTLIQNIKRPLVIIIQGDHGYRFYDNRRKMDEFPNFFAVYFSNKEYRHVPDTLSNVNVFKAVLNTYFRQQIPFDSNKHYFLQYK